jgi:hypothetical protein
MKDYAKPITTRTDPVSLRSPSGAAVVAHHIAETSKGRAPISFDDDMPLLIIPRRSFSERALWLIAVALAVVAGAIAVWVVG